MLVALALTTSLYGLGSAGLHDEDEARYARIAVSMADGHSGFTDPQLDGTPYWNKAPLRLVLGALAVRILGPTEFAARLPSALFGLLTALSLYLLARAWKGRTVACWSTLVLLGSTQWTYHHALRSGTTDTAVVACTLLAILAVRGPRPRTGAVALGFGAAALAGLAKHGAIGLGIALLLTLDLLTRPAGSRPSARAWTAGLTAFALLLLPWHLLQYTRHGVDFLHAYLGREVATRVGGDWGGHYWWGLYPMALKDGLAPWSLLLPWALGMRVLQAGRAGVDRSLALWTFGLLLPPILAQLELEWYLLPALPLLALALGETIESLRKTASGNLVLAGALALTAVSPSNGDTFVPMAGRAVGGRLRVDLLGGLGTTALAHALATVAVLGALGAVGAALRLARHAGPTSPAGGGSVRAAQRAAPAAMALYSLALVLLPLRHLPFEGEEKAAVRIAHAAGAQELGLIGPELRESDILRFYLERFGMRAAGEDAPWTLRDRRQPAQQPHPDEIDGSPPGAVAEETVWTGPRRLELRHRASSDGPSH